MAALCYWVSRRLTSWQTGGRKCFSPSFTEFDRQDLQSPVSCWESQHDVRAAGGGKGYVALDTGSKPQVEIFR